jgi:hypothetical protein
VVSDKDHAHFRRIAAIEAELNDEAVALAARWSPGENIALGFELSAFAAMFGGDVSHPDETPPVSLWRALQQRALERR